MVNDPAAHPPLTERYLLGELSDSERVEFEAHYFQCATCADDVLAGSAFVKNARAALTEDRARAAAKADDRGAPIGWLQRLFAGSVFPAWGLRAAAVGLLPVLGLVGYERLHTIPQLRQEIALRDQPRALAPVTVRPPTRGTPVVIAVRASDRSVVLALELPASADGATSLTAQLRDGGGRPVGPSFSLTPPAPGDPLLMTVPAAPLRAGSYELVIQDNSAELARFPFVVERL
jgi:hypothetical protein